MMPKYILSTFVLITLFACSKKIGEAITPKSLVEFSSLPSKLVVTDENANVLYTKLFVYNSNNQLTKVVTIDTTSGIEKKDSILYFYNGIHLIKKKNTTPKVLEETFVYASGRLKSTHFISDNWYHDLTYFYDQKGEVDYILQNLNATMDSIDVQPAIVYPTCIECVIDLNSLKYDYLISTFSDYMNPNRDISKDNATKHELSGNGVGFNVLRVDSTKKTFQFINANWNYQIELAEALFPVPNEYDVHGNVKYPTSVIVSGKRQKKFCSFAGNSIDYQTYEYVIDKYGRLYRYHANIFHKGVKKTTLTYSVFY